MSKQFLFDLFKKLKCYNCNNNLNKILGNYFSCSCETNPIVANNFLFYSQINTYAFVISINNLNHNKINIKNCIDQELVLGYLNKNFNYNISFNNIGVIYIELNSKDFYSDLDNLLKLSCKISQNIIFI